jgi:hypothetical protein
MQRSPSSLLLLIIRNKDLVYDSLSNLENKNKARRSGKESQPSKVLFISPSKRLKDYYAPRV